jgi:hypothetical protein
MVSQSETLNILSNLPVELTLNILKHMKPLELVIFLNNEYYKQLIIDYSIHLKYATEEEKIVWSILPENENKLNNWLRILNNADVNNNTIRNMKNTVSVFQSPGFIGSNSTVYTMKLIIGVFLCYGFNITDAYENTRRMTIERLFFIFNTIKNEEEFNMTDYIMLNIISNYNMSNETMLIKARIIKYLKSIIDDNIFKHYRLYNTVLHYTEEDRNRFVEMIENNVDPNIAYEETKPDFIEIN